MYRGRVLTEQCVDPAVVASHHAQGVQVAHHGGDHPGDTRYCLQEDYTTETKKDRKHLFQGEKIRLNVSISILFAFISMAIASH